MQKKNLEINSSLSKETENKLKKLAPWHFKFEVGDGIFTTDFNSSRMSTVDPFNLRKLYKRLYPKGMAGKSFLDIGCNGGGYCFLAHQEGARDIYGFEVRDHWIDQCKFLRDSIYKINPQELNFQIDDLMNINREFDFVMFKGVLYHLANPLSALEKVAEITQEYCLIDTAGSIDAPDDTMQIYFEKDGLMAGNESISWLPGSGKLIGKYLDYVGFKSWKILMEKPYPDRRTKRGKSEVPPLSRIRILAKK